MNYADARTIAVDEIPVIDVGPLLDSDLAGIAAVAAEIRKASEWPGFFYVRNHGVPADVIAAANAASRRFFALPPEEKLKVKINERHRGFLAVGEAKMYGKGKVDLKESFLWGLDLGPDDPDVKAGKQLMGANVWPELPGFREAMTAHYDAILDCGNRLLKAIAVSLGIDRDFFVERFRKPLARGSTIYYPPQAPEMGEDQFGVAPHSDYGGLTLLWQDQNGGLQVKTRGGEWVTAHPIEGTLVINIGDLMSRWSNDRFVSTPHRVVNTSGRERYSMAVFFDPSFDTVIDPADLSPPDAPRYPPITCGEYILHRFAEAFRYRK